MNKGFLISSPSSNCGKTLATLGILRALNNQGKKLQPAKAGPDFIDPTYHKIASKGDCVNLDPWAMNELRLKSLVRRNENSILVVEAMMGLYDGALDGSGTAAELAKLLGLPIILVLDCTGQSHSIAALVRGFLQHDSELNFAGVILNKVGSKAHEKLLRSALENFKIKIFGAIYRNVELAVPSRHLGLVLANELPNLKNFIEVAAKTISESLDLTAIASLEMKSTAAKSTVNFKPIGKHIAVADDAAFSFIYKHLLSDWHEQGAKISFFSPLKNESPPKNCDSIFLPGGYPELYCEKLSSNKNFLASLGEAKQQGKFIYGECGGYMALGEGIIDERGNFYPMANLLPLVTSFAKKKLSLGYRKIELQKTCALGNGGDIFTAHEFHYSIVERKKTAPPLFSAKNAAGENLGEMGMMVDNVVGSYLHLIDKSYE